MEQKAVLAGQRIVVTRRREQAASLVDGLRALGATVIEQPTLEIAPPLDRGPLDSCLRRLAEFDWVVFTSPNAVRAVRDAASVPSVSVQFGVELPSPALSERHDQMSGSAGVRGGSPRLASVGAATSDALAEAWPRLTVDLEPEADFRAASLLAKFGKIDLRGSRILLPASDLARDELATGLEALGAEVERVVAYRTVVPEGMAQRLAALVGEGFDLVVFSSPSAVDGFAAAIPGLAAGLPAAVIGPTTEAAAQRAGFAVRAVASPATAQGLLRVIVDLVSGSLTQSSN